MSLYCPQLLRFTVFLSFFWPLCLSLFFAAAASPAASSSVIGCCWANSWERRCQDSYVVPRLLDSFFVLSFLFNFINLFKYFSHLATYGNPNLSLPLSLSLSISICFCLVLLEVFWFFPCCCLPAPTTKTENTISRSNCLGDVNWPRQALPFAIAFWAWQLAEAQRPPYNVRCVEAGLRDSLWLHWLPVWWLWVADTVAVIYVWRESAAKV